jgi:hypothetical protein
MQLFLAKQGDKWLDTAGANAVELDDHGKPQGLKQLDPLLTLTNDTYFGSTG